MTGSFELSWWSIQRWRVLGGYTKGRVVTPVEMGRRVYIDSCKAWLGSFHEDVKSVYPHRLQDVEVMTDTWYVDGLGLYFDRHRISLLICLCIFLWKYFYTESIVYYPPLCVLILPVLRSDPNQRTPIIPHMYTTYSVPFCLTRAYRDHDRQGVLNTPVARQVPWKPLVVERTGGICQMRET